MCFIEKIRNNKIPQPTQPKFKLATWEEEWSREPQKNKNDEGIYQAGKIIFSLLEEIRTELSALQKRKPKISNEKLITAYFSISNRDRAILSNNPEITLTGSANVFSSLLSNNKFSNGLTIEEISNGCVDGIEKAVQFRVSSNTNKDEDTPSDDPFEVIEFISKETFLSQIYDAYESYWQALLWGDYTFYEIDKEKKIFGISQNMTAYEIGNVASHIRKARLDAQSQLVISQQNLKNLFLQNKVILRTSVTGDFSVKTLANADDKSQTMNALWLLQETLLEDEFPIYAINKDHGAGFSIVEALSVLRQLMLLSIQITQSYPVDDGYVEEKKLLSFCPRIKKVKIIKAISKATNHDFQKVSRIMSFLEFNSDKSKDLWCHPVIEVSSASYILLTSALITPVIKRVVEHWIVALGIDLDKKGTVFEQRSLDQLNEALKDNKLINSYDLAVSKRIKLDNGEEEIDFLCRIGKTIIVGEAKSVVTTDSPISCYRTFEILEGAAEQANRKTDFVRNNLVEIFKNLKWTYDDKANYSFVKCVINSNRMYVGTILNDVPICDEKILIRYFESKTAPLLTNKEMKNIAWFELYDSFETLQKNLDVYLKNPHQVSLLASYYEHKDMPVPALNPDSYKILYSRIVPKDCSAKEMLGRNYKFPIKTVDNIDDELKDPPICI